MLPTFRKMLCLSFLGMTPSAWGAEPQVKPLISSGEACPQGTAVGKLGQNLHYGITFVSEKTEAVAVREQESVNKSCEVSVEVVMPRNYQLRVDKFILNGWHLTKGHSYTRVDARYGLYDKTGNSIGDEMYKIVEPLIFPQGNDVEKAEGFEREEGPFEIVWKMQEPMWSPCSKTIVLKGNLDLTATRIQSPVSAEIALHNSNTGFSSHMVWAWKMRPCQESSDSFQGTWQSTYEAQNGEHVDAKLEITGDHGTYKTRYFTGTLFRITQNGSLVKGYWKVGQNQGWFQFEIQNDRFQGQWGKGNWGDHPQGNWWGHRGSIIGIFH